MNRIVFISASAMAGLIAGVGFRAWRHPHGGQGSGKEKNSASAVSPGVPPKPPAARSSALVDQAQVNLSLSEGVTRWLHWMTAVEKAGPADFPGLARLAQGLPGALNMLAARWIDRDPRGLFAACLQGGAGFPANDLAQRLFEAWPKNDPDAVLGVLLENRNLSQGWQFTALNTLFQVRPEEALIAMSRLGVNNYSPNMEGIAGWAASHPQHAAEVAFAHPAGFATQQVLETVAKEWAKSDPSGALAFAMEQQSSPATELANHVIREWAEKDLSKASAWFAAADERTKNTLLPAFIEAWGKSDAPQALQWCYDNTTGTQQAEVVQSLVKGVLARDIDAAAALVGGMTPSPSRTKAAAALAREAVNKGWFPGRIAPDAQQAAKREAIAWLNQLDPDSRKEALSQLSYSWSEGAPREFAAFLQSDGGKEASPDVLSIAVRALARENPQEAMAWAAQTPESVRDRTVTETFQHWTRSQPDAAFGWLRDLPAQDPHREDLYLSAVESLLPSSAFTGPTGEVPEPPDALKRRLARDLARSPATARQALAQLPLSPAERQRVFNQLRLDPP